jgi:hypothetical protein
VDHVDAEGLVERVVRRVVIEADDLRAVAGEVLPELRVDEVPVELEEPETSEAEERLVVAGPLAAFGRS